jgi:hypothetical protein
MSKLRNRVLKPRLSYEEKLATFADGRLFHEVEPGMVHEANGQKCQACGSAAPKMLRLIEDMSGNKYLVGSNCCLALHTIPDDKYWEAFKAIGKPIERWIQENKAQLQHKPYFMWLELYLKNSEDKAG